ncbi:monovalent cation/H+ antiporter complex subunit F [Histidinibacterium aquaticum]|uniref:pH regulation protein F n=1 Tax=Histidinibacterium aquaticum TaxID=2613962 RepID=A0A5J5GCR2_9RHOB|nr:monovalent cation/H+ antiporter complex subunit F [Histidinibacterium aquaticum]KAA9005758.1 pH regulation protein F [Histidinibacterium aquaticum]
MILDSFAVAALIATLLTLPRLLVGPSAADRIAAAQLAGTGVISTLVLMGAATSTSSFYSIALVFAGLAAVTGIAFVALGAAKS